MIYANIEHSKDLKDLFPDAEMWWGRHPMTPISKPEYYICNKQWGEYPALTTDQCLGVMSKKHKMKAFKEYLRTNEKFVNCLCKWIVISRDEWKEIEGYNTSYSINKKGQILSNNAGIIGQYKGNRGVMTVRLSKGRKRVPKTVHRLVAQAFMPNPENKPCVNHKDGNPSNNNLDNLEWVTISENALHSYHVLGKKGGFDCGEKSYNSKLTKSEVLEIRRKYVKDVYGTYKLAKEFKMSRTAIQHIVQRKNWKHI